MNTAVNQRFTAKLAEICLFKGLIHSPLSSLAMLRVMGCSLSLAKNLLNATNGAQIPVVFAIGNTL